jgi:signal transduction histidine kinase
LMIVEQELERMAALISNLLQFSRFGKEQVSTVDVRNEVEQTLDLVFHHLRNRGVTVKTEFVPGLPCIYADRQKLRQVLLNLITNAGDAMPKGGTLTLRVRPSCLKGGVNAVAIEVADTGVGIPPELLPKVMDAFFTTKDEGKGTGLGLAICRRIANEHDGTLEIESQVGKGTMVCVTIPVSPGEYAEQLRETL